VKINGGEVTFWGIVASLAIWAVIALLRAGLDSSGEQQEERARLAEKRRIETMLQKDGRDKTQQ
jgi:sensor domain CHASE-containing protein